MGRVQSPNPFVPTFEALLQFLEKKCKEPLLTYQLKKFAHLIEYAPYSLTLRLSPDVPENFALHLKKTLENYTNHLWTLDLKSEGGEETVAQQEKKRIEIEKDQVLSHPFIKKIIEIFPGTVIHVRPEEK